MVDVNDIKIDLSVVSIREYRALFDKDQPQDAEDATIAKACGITVDELLDLPQPDYRRLCKRFFDAAREPLADPN
jgi:hypothetical protein